MYFSMHKLIVQCKSSLAQAELASNNNKTAAILGRGFHMKGWEPFFPKYSFKSGHTEYPL